MGGVVLMGVNMGFDWAGSSGRDRPSSEDTGRWWLRYGLIVQIMTANDNVDMSAVALAA